MSDNFVIPGVTSKIDSPKMVEALVNVKKVKLEQMQKDVDDAKESKEIWQDIGGRINKIKDKSKDLFGYNNPFNEKIAESTNERVLTATATREAFESEKKIRVEQVATADRFISKSLDKNFKVESGTYGFAVGGKETSFKFAGGSLTEFAASITRNGNDLIQAHVINDTKNSQVLVIESLKTGSKNRLVFSGKALDLALSIGMVERAQNTAKTVDLKTTAPERWEKKLDSEVYKITGEAITLNPKAELKLPITPKLALNKDMILEFEVSVKELPAKPTAKKPLGPDYPFVGDINYKGVRVENERSVILLPETEEPSTEKLTDMQVLFAGNGKSIIPLPEIDPGANKQKVKVPLGEMIESIDALYMRNKNSDKSIEISNIRIYDSKAYGDYKPVDALSTSNDAIIHMDGVRIMRETNDIDDLIPGVKITLKEASDEKVGLKVKRDIEAIMDGIIGFVGNYNQLMGQLNILTRSSDDVLNSLDYLTPEERETAKKRMGKMQGDITILQLKRSLQTNMMNPYHTAGGNALSLLAHLGISTNSAKPGSSGSVDRTKLLGYLEIDEKSLEETVTRHADWVKELFGRDSDNDRIVDSGLAYSIDTTLRPYTQTGGLLASKSDGLNKRITQKNKEIEDYNEYLERYEADLKRKYAMMEGMLNTLDKSSKALDNFSKQNGGK